MGKEILVEKYRPSSLEDVILADDSVKVKFQEIVDNKSTGHLLLSGPAGTGKTTCARIIAKALSEDILYLNASDENNIDTVRTKIKDFCTCMGMSELKVAILDECLEENTLVRVLSGGKEKDIPIKEVDPINDLVKTFNLKTSQIEWKPFDLIDKGDQDLYEICLENGEVVVCTETHKWFVEDSESNVKVVSTKELGNYNHILSP